MIACEKCGKSNSLDSLFCRTCGEAIADALIAQARAENEGLVHEGYRLLGENRFQEATLVAETALKHDPISSSALSLLGDCHEQSGRFADALDCYERLLEQTPNSTLDRIKVSHLRRRLSAQTAAPEPRGKRSAIMAALAAVTLVGSLGAVVALAQSPSSSTKKEDGMSSPLNSGLSTEGFGLANNPGKSATETGSEKVNPTTGNESQTPATDDASREPSRPSDTGRNSSPPLARNGSGRALPSVSGNGGMAPIGPLNPFPNVSVIPETNSSARASAKSNPDDVDPSPERSGNVAAKNGGESAKVSPPDDPGIIEIRGASGNPVQRGGSEVIPESGKSESLVRSGKNDLQIGDHGRAASAFEKALASGAPAGSTNQHLGRAYERMGKASDAIAAYRRSITANERDLASGKGDAARIRAAIDACKQAIRVLQGK